MGSTGEVEETPGYTSRYKDNEIKDSRDERESLGAKRYPCKTMLKSSLTSFPPGDGKSQAMDRVGTDTKSIHTQSPVLSMAITPSSTMWLAMQDGRVEVRDVHTGQLVHTFPTMGVRQRRSKVWSMLSIPDAVNHASQVWLGLSSGAIEVYSEDYQLLRQLSKHVAGVYCLAQSAGMYAFAGSSDFLVSQWRVSDGQLLRILKGHSNYVRCLYAESSVLISGSDDETIRVWDTTSGQCLHRFTHLHRSRGGVSALCRVGTSMWSGDDTGSMVVWQLKNGQVLLVCTQLTTRITAIRKIGSRVYVGSADGQVCVFNASDCTLMTRLTDHAGSHITAISCAIEVDRYYVWSGSADNTIRCWHHDEHHPMTTKREGTLDMRWYYSTQQPYKKSNEVLLEQQRELSELVTLSSGSDDAVRRFLDNNNEGRQTAAARYWLLNNKLKAAEHRCAKAEEEGRTISDAVQRKKNALAILRSHLNRVTEAVSAVRLSAATAPSVAPVPLTPGFADQGPLAPVPPSVIPVVLGSVNVPTPLPPPTTTSIPPPPPPAIIPAAPSPALPAPSSVTIAVPSLTSFPEQHATVFSESSFGGPLRATALTSPSSKKLAPFTITEVQVTRSQSYEPVLGAVPPPPPPVSFSSTGAVPKAVVETVMPPPQSVKVAPVPAAVVRSSPLATPRPQPPMTRRASF